jgi:hypothetical protein
MRKTNGENEKILKNREIFGFLDFFMYLCSTMIKNKVMTQEDKQLLLRDLCARLPYGVKISYVSLDGKICGEPITLTQIDYKFDIEEVKPYLRPLSSMTEEEEKEFGKIFELELKAIEAPEGHTIVSAASSTFEIDFYNKYHFDYRGLIEKGLAIAVTEENNPYK